MFILKIKETEDERDDQEEQQLEERFKGEWGNAEGMMRVASDKQKR